MKITLEPTHPEPASTEKIIVNGVEIGVLTTEDVGKCRVRINAMSNTEGVAMLYQGHGETPEAALQQLITRHRGYARAQLRRVDELEKDIFGTVTPDDDLLNACIAALSQLTEDRPEYLDADIDQLRRAIAKTTGTP